MKTHTVPRDLFDRIASGGGGTSGALHDGRRSKRLLLLREVVSAARHRAAEVFVEGRSDEAFTLLADARRRWPSAVDDVVLQPHVGAWATSCLRQLLTGDRLPPEELGHLGAIAAAAALRTGQSFEPTACLRGDGSLMLPTYGLARVGSVGGWCQVRSQPGAGGVEVVFNGTATAVRLDQPAGADDRWRPLRRLGCSVAGLAFDMHLDDVDPYRGCGHLPVMDRLSAAAIDDWQAKLDDAWAVLAEDHREQAEAIADGVISIVPLQPTEGAEEMSATCYEAGGAVSMTPPRQSLGLALALVHEFQHTKLSALLDLVPLLDRAPGNVFYAPWRADPRPLSGLLQGIYAFLGLAAFWETHRRRGPDEAGAAEDWAHFEFALGRGQVGEAVGALRSSGRLLPPGALFVEKLGQRLADLRRQPVPLVPKTFARLVRRDHGLSWRLRNLRPDPEEVATGAAAWLAGRPCPWPGRPPTDVLDGGGPIPSGVRLELVRRRLAHPERWLEEVSEAATAADVLLVEGDRAAAAAAYAAQLAAVPDDLASWSGLAVAHHGETTPAARALTVAPEAVYALHREILARGGAPDAEALAAWVGTGMGPSVPPERPTAEAAPVSDV